ncbi:MAG: sigma-54-dependent Fis family transcriptional regulator [Planctomycetota bacterium]|nr:sigma-54-dependent Fis family transcriptional regulator [Planctomycetota bacterium]
MVQLRVYRGGALLGELDLTGDAVEIGDREGDVVRWDRLGLAATPGFGGRLARLGGRWVFHAREAGASPTPLTDGDVLPIGDGSIEVVETVSGPVVAVATIPDDEVTPVGVASVPHPPGSAGERIRLLADFLSDVDLGAPSEEVLHRALDQAFRLVQCERGIAAMREADGGELRVVASQGMSGDDPRSELSRRVLETVLGQGRDVFTGNAPVDIPTVSVNLQSIRAICALPLKIQSQVGGVLYVDRGPSGSPFSEEDLAFLQLLATLVGRRLEEARRYVEAETERRRLAGKLASRDAEEERDLAWTSPAMRKVRGDAERLLRAFQGRSLPVLITGESGTGKEVLARWLHSNLDGNAGPFVAVNCAAIPKELAESELFGIEQGVASGVMRRIGKFQQANGGTLFLDEVGEMDLPIQTKLLRALESRTIVRVGGREELPIDVRIISATNAVFTDMIREGTFREDLFWRLNGVEVGMPPLRERREDIPVLCEVFARKYAEDFGLPAPTFDREAMARLMAWSWPGNVRELKQRVGALTALVHDGVIRVDDLPGPIASGTDAAHGPSGFAAESNEQPLVTLAELEMAHIHRVLKATGGDRARAADILGIHKKTLGRKLAAQAAENAA